MQGKSAAKYFYRFELHIDISVREIITLRRLILFLKN